MSTPEGPGRAPATPGLTSLPRLEDLPRAPGGGYDADRVRDAFNALRRHTTQPQAQLRVLQAAGRTGGPPPAAAEPPVSRPSAEAETSSADDQDDGEEQPRNEPA